MCGLLQKRIGKIKEQKCKHKKSGTIWLRFFVFINQNYFSNSLYTSALAPTMAASPDFN